MFNFYKYLNRVFLNCSSILLLYSISILDLRAMALAKEKEMGGVPILRGEIWYGNASWYGSKFHGRKTSSGEKYNKNKLTAAHPTLPFNTKVLITNLKNNKSVVVRINDRGPFVKDRILDMSEEAAEKIDVKKQGIVYIKIQVLTHLIENNKRREKES